MKKLSTAKLAETLKMKREEKGLTQEDLSKKTGINRVMIGRIENENYIPSITQMESLGNVLEFQITDMFVEKNKKNSFVALRSASSIISSSKLRIITSISLGDVPIFLVIELSFINTSSFIALPIRVYSPLRSSTE